MLTILRIFIVYKPLRFFVTGGTLFLVPGVVIGFVSSLPSPRRGEGHMQSLILAGVLIVTAVVI